MSRVIRGFTAVELVIVISIIGILSLMIAPRIIDGLRKSAVRSAAQDIIATWREARTMAMTKGTILPTTSASIGDLGKYFGVAITQSATGHASVGVVFDTRSTQPEGLDPDKPTGKTLPKSVIVSTRDGTAGTEPTPITTDLVWYAQRGTGVPIRHQDLGLGGNAPACGIGVPLPTGTPSVARELIVHTADFDPANKRGFAVAVMIYPIGVGVTQELVR